MNELDRIEGIKGGFFSPISIIVSVGLIGIGIGLCKNLISKNFKNFIVRGY
jgi:hypothetical protein